MRPSWNFIIETPPRYAKNSENSVIEKSWNVEFPDFRYVKDNKDRNKDRKDGKNEKYEFDKLDFVWQAYSFPLGIQVNATIQWIEESLLSARIHIKTAIKGECARCLADAELAISDDLMYLYYLRGLELGKDTKLQSDDGYMPVEVDFWGRTISLADQVWETLMTLLPLRLLCKDDCAGLCQNCGHNLNEGTCSCNNLNNNSKIDSIDFIESIDSRFEVLRNFF